jgi:glycerate kinase
VIGIAGSLTKDVGVVHQYGIDAVFSVLTSIGSLEEDTGSIRKLYNAILRRLCRWGCARKGDGVQTLYTARRS